MSASSQGTAGWPGFAARLAVTLAIATAGGWLLNEFDVPLAWMLGAMTSTAILALAGAPLQGTAMLRPLMLAVLGVAIGSAFKPNVLDGMADWLPSLGAIAGYVVVTTLAGTFVLRRGMGWNKATAFFSATPGGLTDMMIAGTERGGDERVLALFHSLRIMMTVIVIPLSFSLSGYVPEIVERALSPTWEGLTENGALWLVGSGLAGVVIGRVVRLPAYVFVGPMIVSAVIHLTGVTSSRPPADLVSAAQVVIGAGIGCRFVGIALREVAKVMAIGATYGVALVAVSGAAAALLAPVTGASVSSLWLSFAPGGLPEMVLMSLALGLDQAFVSTHHLFRFVFILLTARALYWLLERYVYRR